MKRDVFRAIIWDYYTNNQRKFPWRHVDDPYHVYVSEVMLQQTQTHRVEKKFTIFVSTFTNFQALATASLRDVLLAWQGLGYNRRAMALHKSARIITDEFDGIVPEDPAVLITLPGIGPATAASIAAFAFNHPTVFIETNIRTVFLHFFFSGKHDVHDRDLLPLVAANLDRERPREWYYALMDYGVMLKKSMPNPSRRSRHHTIQSIFEGSDRQIRGALLKLIAQHEKLHVDQLCQLSGYDRARIQKMLTALETEGFLCSTHSIYSIL